MKLCIISLTLNLSIPFKNKIEEFKIPYKLQNRLNFNNGAMLLNSKISLVVEFLQKWVKFSSNFMIKILIMSR